MRAGLAIRQAAALEAAAAKTCGCGHPMGSHFELKPTYEIVGTEVAVTPHPDYRPGDFHCNHDDCACVVRPS